MKVLRSLLPSRCSPNLQYRRRALSISKVSANWWVLMLANYRATIKGLPTTCSVPRQIKRQRTTCHVQPFCTYLLRFFPQILHSFINRKHKTRNWNSPVRVKPAKTSQSTRSVALNLQRTKGPRSAGIFVGFYFLFFLNHLTFKRQGEETLAHGAFKGPESVLCST